MVTRDELRLTLSGRSVIEHIEVPAYIPKNLRRYYSGAVLAYNCNQVLPALFMLRTLIEQHMRSVAGDGHKSGDALCDAYAKTLDDAFKKKFPSLGEAYDKVSDALHAAREDEKLFKEQRDRILPHFDALRLWQQK